MGASEAERLCVVRNIDRTTFADEGGGGIVSMSVQVFDNGAAARLVLRMKKRELAKLATLMLEQTQVRQDEFRTETRIVHTP